MLNLEQLQAQTDLRKWIKEWDKHIEDREQVKLGVELIKK